MKKLLTTLSLMLATLKGSNENKMKHLLIFLILLTSVPAKAALNPDKTLNIPLEVQQFLQTQTQSEFGRYFLMRIKKAVTGDALSQLIVGGVFLASRKLPQHLERAYMWTYLAKQGGIPEASNLLNDEIIPRMKPKQIKQAIAMAETCLKSKYKRCW